MICSASELDLWDDHDGILLLDDKLLPGTDFSTIYSSNDFIWEVGVTPNRGDCMSYLGIARELSGYFNKKLITFTKCKYLKKLYYSKVPPLKFRFLKVKSEI